MDGIPGPNTLDGYPILKYGVEEILLAIKKFRSYKELIFELKMLKFKIKGNKSIDYCKK